MFNFVAAWRQAFVLQWGSSTHNLQQIHSFPQAQRYFKETARPRGTKWQDSQRPLYNSRAHHYRIEVQEKLNCYDLVLYSTPMVRLFEDGRVWLHTDYRSTSIHYMAEMGWARWRDHLLNNGERGFVPLSYADSHEYVAANGVVVPVSWSAVVVKDKSERIVLSKSAHRPIYTRVTSKEDRDMKAAFKAKQDLLIDTLLLRLPAFEEHQRRIAAGTQPNRWRRSGGPFDTQLDYTMRGARDKGVKALAGDVTTENVEALVEVGQAVYSFLEDRREYEASEQHPAKPITRDDFRRSLETCFIKLAGFDNASARKEYPQFPTSVPRKWIGK